MHTVLILDGDMATRTLLASALADEYLVRAVSCPSDAISFLRQNPVDLIVMEVGTDDSGGLSVLAYVAGMHPQPQVVIHTAQTHLDKVVKLMRLGVTEYLVKPADLEVIRSAVRNALQDHKG